MAYNPPIGSIYHLYTTYILPSGGLYATYHPLQEPEKSIDNIFQLGWNHQLVEYDKESVPVAFEGQTPNPPWGYFFSGREFGAQVFGILWLPSLKLTAKAPENSGILKYS